MLIRLKDIYKDYLLGSGENFRALGDVNLEIASGEFVAIMGPSGSGKTTLANILGCLMRPSGGQYFFEGNDISKAKDRELEFIRADRLGFIFQDYVLLDKLSALENVAIALNYSNLPYRKILEKSKDILADLGLKDKFGNFPNQLSGGQKQRVAIARALVTNPTLIIADEPAGALDHKSRYDVLSILQDLNNNGKTILMVTHSDRDAKAASRIIEIDFGSIVEDRVVADRSYFHNSGALSDSAGSKVSAQQLKNEILKVIGFDSSADLFAYLSDRSISDEDKVAAMEQVGSKIFHESAFVEKLGPLLYQQSDEVKAALVGTAIRCNTGDLSKADELVFGYLKSNKWKVPLLKKLITEVINKKSHNIASYFNIDETLDHSSEQIRSLAVKLVGLMAWPEVKKEEALLQKLNDSDQRVRANAIEELLSMELGDRLVRLDKFSEEKSPRVKSLLAKAHLLHGNREKAAEILRSMLSSNNPSEYKSAMYLCSHMDNKTLLSAIDIIQENNPDFVYQLSDVIENIKRVRVA